MITILESNELPAAFDLANEIKGTFACPSLFLSFEIIEALAAHTAPMLARRRAAGVAEGTTWMNYFKEKTDESKTG